CGGGTGWHSWWWRPWRARRWSRSRPSTARSAARGALATPAAGPGGGGGGLRPSRPRLGGGGRGMSEGATQPAAEARSARDRVIHPRPLTPDDERPRRPRSNLTLRLVTAAFLIPSVLWMIYQGGVFVLGTVVVITLIGLNEFYQLIEQKGAEPLRGQGMAAAAALPVVMYFGYESLATVLMTAVLLALMVVQLAKNRISE